MIFGFNESRYVLPFWSTEVKMPWGYDYTWNTILISWENLLGETINMMEILCVHINLHELKYVGKQTFRSAGIL